MADVIAVLGRRLLTTTTGPVAVVPVVPVADDEPDPPAIDGPDVLTSTSVLYADSGQSPRTPDDTSSTDDT